MKNDLSFFKDLYIQTANEYLANLQNGIRQLPSNPKNNELINQIYIDVHSLKSQSIAMGYKNTGVLSGVIEHIFKTVKDGKIQVSDKLITLILNSVEKLKSSVNKIQTDNREIDLSEQFERLKRELELKINF